jgi:hypothetical protein
LAGLPHIGVWPLVAGELPFFTQKQGAPPIWGRPLLSCERTWGVTSGPCRDPYPDRSAVGLEGYRHDPGSSRSLFRDFGQERIGTRLDPFGLGLSCSWTRSYLWSFQSCFCSSCSPRWNRLWHHPHPLVRSRVRPRRASGPSQVQE